MYYAGHGVAQDTGEAARWWHKAAEQGDADAQCELGGMYEAFHLPGMPNDVGNFVAEDYAEAARWYRKAADQGMSKLRRDSASCTKTAKVYLRIPFRRTCGLT
jgi:uncharacterized protein